MKKVVGLVALLALGSASAVTVKIASLSPLSGPASNIGEQIKLGTDLALREAAKNFQSKYGIDLVLAGNDDQATPDVGVAAAKKLAADKEVLAIVGTLNSGVAIPASEAVKDDYLTFVSPANTNVKVTDRGLANMNRICGRDDAQGKAGADFILKNLKGKNVFILHDKTPYGEGLASEVRKGLGTKAKVLGFEGTEEQANFQSLVIKVKALNPDVIYWGGLANQGGVLIKQLRDNGVTAKFVGGDGLDDSTLQKIAGDAAKGVYFTTAAASVDVVPAAKTFSNNFEKTFGKQAEGYGLMSYDAAKVVLAGIEKAIKDNKVPKGQAPSREQVQKAIRGVKVKALTGTIEFNSVGDRKSGYLYIVEIQNNLDPKTIGSVKISAPKQ